jgi:ammonia channel protein AmtB
MICGGVTGTLSVWSLVLVQPALAKAGFYDSSAVFSAHFVPGFVSAVGSAIAFARVNPDFGYSIIQQTAILPTGRSPLVAGGYQFAFFCISVAFAAIAGVCTGAILNLPIFEDKGSSEYTCNDDHDDFQPIAEVGRAGRTMDSCGAHPQSSRSTLCPRSFSAVSCPRGR